MSCSASIYASIDTPTLQAWLAQLIQARIDLVSGGKVQVVSYAQADGSRMVTYTPADRGAIMAEIVGLQGELTKRGVLSGGGRKPMIPVFR